MQKSIAIFGASGKTGNIVTKQLIKECYTVKALVRNPDKLAPTSKNITILQGDATNYDVVEQTIDGTYAVISVLGYSKDSKKGFQTKAIENIIAAMQKKQVKRIIILTGTGVYFEGDKFTAGNWLITLLIKSIAPDRFKDGVSQSKFLAQSGLDWTIVRAPLLTNGKEKKVYKTGILRIEFFSHISREDVAGFMLKLLKDNSFIKQAPQISY
jgi:putative NADH-flavin reductase